MKEALNDQPFLHPVVWARCNVLLQTFPSFCHGFISELLEARDLVPQRVSFPLREILRQKRIGTRVPSCECCSVEVEPLFCLPNKREGKETKFDGIQRRSFHVEGAANL